MKLSEWCVFLSDRDRTLLLPRVRTESVKHCFTHLQDKGYACVGGHSLVKSPTYEPHISKFLKNPDIKAILLLIVLVIILSQFTTRVMSATKQNGLNNLLR